MTKLILPAAFLLAMTFAFASADTAEARGFHFGGGGVHVDVGNSHGGHGGYFGHQPYYPQPYWGGGWGGGHQWHNTSHVDYHPTQHGLYNGHNNWHATGHGGYLHP